VIALALTGLWFAQKKNPVETEKKRKKLIKNIRTLSMKIAQTIDST
jgi:hypothetical protein